jgi:DNA-directed RNA polymerase specialized sigma24 family protein
VTAAHAAAIYPPLRAKAFELVRDDFGADDLTQATMLRLLEKPPARQDSPRELLHYARMVMRTIWKRDFLAE